jgi:hypothetical protein
MRRLIAILACCVAAFLALAATASAELPVCGTTPPGASQPVKATLALADTDPETVTAALYGRRTGVRQLTFVYNVSGCRVTNGLALPADPPPIGPPKDDKVGTIPKGVIRIDGRPEADGNQYVVHMQVFTAPPAYTDPGTGKKIAPKFDPGTYGGFLHLKAGWMHRTGTLVAISRSENRWLFVLGAAVIGALGGFVVFMLLHAFARANLLVGGWRVAIAGALSIGVGAYVAYTTNYLNQDVWTLGANTLALLTAAFTAATSGHLVTGLLGKVYDDHASVNPPGEKARRGGLRGLARRMRRSGGAETDQPGPSAEPAPDASVG